MGIVLGYVTLVCLCILFTKALTRKLHVKRADKILMKIHKPICVVALICCCFHTVLVLPVLKTRSVYIWITGIAAVVVAVLLILFCHMIKEREQRLRWHRILSVMMLGIIICHMIAYVMDFKNYQEKIKAIQIHGADAGKLADGKYVGAYDAGYIYAEVEVTLQHGKIINIEIVEHRNERGKPAERIVDEIIKEQSTDVDAVSGATNSSNVIKKAVEAALEN